MGLMSLVRHNSSGNLLSNAHNRRRHWLATDKSRRRILKVARVRLFQPAIPECDVTMTEEYQRTGQYPISTAASREVDRLQAQHEAWSDDANWLLGQIGIKPGWRCLDLGCGPRGLTEMLSERVGPEVVSCV